MMIDTLINRNNLRLRSVWGMWQTLINWNFSLNGSNVIWDIIWKRVKIAEIFDGTTMPIANNEPDKKDPIYIKSSRKPIYRQLKLFPNFSKEAHYQNISNVFSF